MATCQYTRQMSGIFIIDCQTSQVTMVRPSHPSRYANLITLQGTEDGSRRRGGSCKSLRDNIKEWTGQSLSLCAAHHRPSQTTEVDG